MFHARFHAHSPDDRLQSPVVDVADPGEQVVLHLRLPRGPELSRIAGGFLGVDWGAVEALAGW